MIRVWSVSAEKLQETRYLRGWKTWCPMLWASRGSQSPKNSGVKDPTEMVEEDGEWHTVNVNLQCCNNEWPLTKKT